jgi:hypothetical protein
MMTARKRKPKSGACLGDLWDMTRRVARALGPFYLRKSSQVNTLPKAKSKTRSKQNKDMQKCSSVYTERGVPLPVVTSGGE